MKTSQSYHNSQERLSSTATNRIEMRGRNKKEWWFSHLAGGRRSDGWYDRWVESDDEDAMTRGTLGGAGIQFRRSGDAPGKQSNSSGGKICFGAISPRFSRCRWRFVLSSDLFQSCSFSSGSLNSRMWQSQHSQGWRLLVYVWIYIYMYIYMYKNCDCMPVFHDFFGEHTCEARITLIVSQNVDHWYPVSF